MHVVLVKSMQMYAGSLWNVACGLHISHQLMQLLV